MDPFSNEYIKKAYDSSETDYITPDNLRKIFVYHVANLIILYKKAVSINEKEEYNSYLRHLEKTDKTDTSVTQLKYSAVIMQGSELEELVKKEFEKHENPLHKHKHELYENIYFMTGPDDDAKKISEQETKKSD